MISDAVVAAFTPASSAAVTIQLGPSCVSVRACLVPLHSYCAGEGGNVNLLFVQERELADAGLLGGVGVCKPSLECASGFDCGCQDATSDSVCCWQCSPPCSAQLTPCGGIHMAIFVCWRRTLFNAKRLFGSHLTCSHRCNLFCWPPHTNGMASVTCCAGVHVRREARQASRSTASCDLALRLCAHTHLHRTRAVLSQQCVHTGGMGVGCVALPGHRRVQPGCPGERCGWQGSQPRDMWHMLSLSWLAWAV